MQGLIECTGLESAEVSGLRLTQPPLQRRFVFIRVDSWLTSCAEHRSFRFNRGDLIKFKF